MRLQDGRVFPRGSASSSNVEIAQLWWDTWDKHNLQVSSHLSILIENEFDTKI